MTEPYSLLKSTSSPTLIWPPAIRQHSVQDLAPGPLPVPDPGRIDLWVVGDSESVPVATLSDDEISRANRYRVDRPRQQFQRTRGFLRVLLGQYLQCDPAAIQFRLGTDGKPCLQSPKGLEYNVSHTDGYFVIGIARVSIGVDVEYARNAQSCEALVRRYFTVAEQAQWVTLPEELKTQAFLRGWTCKEALLKASGCGSRGLEGCDIDLDPRSPARIRKLRGPVCIGGPWLLASSQCGAEHAISVAWSEPHCSIAQS